MKKIDQQFGTEDAALLKGILTGNDSEIAEETINAFRSSGIAHVMAVSGLHFGILYMIVFWLLSKGMSILRLPYGCIALSTMVIMFIFVFITGGRLFQLFAHLSWYFYIKYPFWFEDVMTFGMRSDL